MLESPYKMIEFNWQPTRYTLIQSKCGTKTKATNCPCASAHSHNFSFSPSACTRATEIENGFEFGYYMVVLFY